jgi:hypothetical protein
LTSIMSKQLEVIQYPIIMAPFHGVMVPIKLRELTQAQIRACGNFSLIETFEDKVRVASAKVTMREVTAYAERHHEIAKRALVAPTYDEILQIFKSDKTVAAAKEQMLAIKEKLRTAPRGPLRSALEEELENMRIWCELLLPEDFLGFIVSYTLGVDKSDIKEVTQEMLLDAAILAERGSDNPADHIDGTFTPFMRDDINSRAWVILEEWKKEHTPKQRNKRM